MISEDHAILLDRWLYDQDKFAGRSADPGLSILIMRRPTHTWEDMQEAKRCTEFVKRCIESEDVEGARAWATIAARWGRVIERKEYDEVMRRDKERAMDNCVYKIELNRCQARAWENDSRSFERQGNSKMSRAMMQAAADAWRVVETYQRELLDLTRE